MKKKQKLFFIVINCFIPIIFFSSWTKLGHLFQGLIHILKSSFIYSTSINEKMFFFFKQNNKKIQKIFYSKKFFHSNQFFIVLKLIYFNGKPEPAKPRAKN